MSKNTNSNIGQPQEDLLWQELQAESPVESATKRTRKRLTNLTSNIWAFALMAWLIAWAPGKATAEERHTYKKLASNGQTMIVEDNFRNEIFAVWQFDDRMKWVYDSLTSGDKALVKKYFEIWKQNNLDEKWTRLLAKTLCNYFFKLKDCKFVTSFYIYFWKKNLE